jgi:DNA-binding SARP family transcriptional activator
MLEGAFSLASLGRLISRIEQARIPLVYLWGWPGSGAPAVLAACLERWGREACGLSLAALTDREGVAQAIAAARAAGGRRFVLPSLPRSEEIGWALEALHPGERLICTGERRHWIDGFAMTVVAPQELLLSHGEVAAVWHLELGGAPAPPAVEALWAATDGWYEPVRLALQSTLGAGLAEADASALLALPAVRRFLRHDVLGTFAPVELELLLATPRERPAEGAEGTQGWRLVDERGLWLEGATRDRLPHLLWATLEHERQRRGETPRAGVRLPIAAVPTYTLGLLGSAVARLRDERGERDLARPLKRSFQVLAYLASAPGLAADKEELIEAIWASEGERTIERNFHPTLSHLRRALEAGRAGPPPMTYKNGVYRLNGELRWEIDLFELTRLAEEGRRREAQGDLAGSAEARRRAWRFYRGPFLQGHYEAWVAQRREHYQRIYLDLLRDLGNLELGRGHLEPALDAYRTILLEDALEERVHVAVMQIYAAQKRRDLVRKQYDRLSALLLDELGVAPAEETTREYHRLMGSLG